ncbi:Uncharacterised protein [Mycobacteroides abscessus subsp. abscessus]|nr:Uncharacterised protein [Mycobacteroides abscessus subsp. abscessus]
MRAALIAAVAAALIGAVTACSSPASGVIIEKDHDRGSCTTTNRKVKCASDSFELEIRTDRGEEVEISVDRAEFYRYQVGDRYPR